MDSVKPVYDLLLDLDMRTTKTVWVYPPRDKFTGQSLTDEEYLVFVQYLKDRGFEIALHGVGSGSFSREEIISGLDYFKDSMGDYPYIQINHAENPHNIYWGYDRYVFPLRGLIRLMYQNKKRFYGDDIDSEYFWGDLCKRYIKYTRNHCFNGINTLRYDPLMPGRIHHKLSCSNYWFSSSDGHTIQEFFDLIAPANIEKLERENGACIVYTHFGEGFVDKRGEVRQEFAQRLRFLAGRPGWFVPAGALLDHLSENKADREHSISYLRRLDRMWFMERIVKKLRYRR